MKSTTSHAGRSWSPRMARAYPGYAAAQIAKADEREARDLWERVVELERAFDALYDVVVAHCCPGA
jgi:hypothetical protein